MLLAGLIGFTLRIMILPRIPKKKDSEITPEDGDGWGLHIVEGIAMVRVVVWAMITVVVTIVLWAILWLIEKDSQTVGTVVQGVGVLFSVLLFSLQLSVSAS